ncbi:MAG: DnaJ C-terminal domain-containing protein [Myxococcota bacterium]
MKDLYAVLGVARDADQASIKKAFKTLARKYHPDVSKEAGAQDRFKEISAAYEVLGDEQKRALYDEFGEVSLRAGFDPEQARAFKNMGGGFRPGPDFGGGAGPYPGGGFGGGAGFDFDDLLGNLFGRGGGAGRRPDGPRGGADIEGRVTIDFLDAVRGGEVPIQVRRPGPCGACKGEGGRGRKPCTACRGSGRRAVRQLGLNVLAQCDECGGTGATWAEECATCGGTGRVRELVNLQVRVPPGVDSGQLLRLRGQGGAGVHGGPAGDLLLTVDVRDHALLHRKGRDLEMDLPLTLAEALGGGSVEVPTPTGKVRVKVPKGSNNGTRLRIAGRGVQLKEGAGDLYLVLRPMLPATSDAEALELASQLDAKGAEGGPRANLQL